MEAFSVLLTICAGNSPVPGEFPAQKPVTRSFDVFFDLRLNKRLSKQSWGWWFETLLRPLWRHSNVIHMLAGTFHVPLTSNDIIDKTLSCKSYLSADSLATRSWTWRMLSYAFIPMIWLVININYGHIVSDMTLSGAAEGRLSVLKRGG